VCRTRS